MRPELTPEQVVNYMRFFLKVQMLTTSEIDQQLFDSELHRVSGWDLHTLAYHTSLMYPSFKKDLEKRLMKGSSGLFDGNED